MRTDLAFTHICCFQKNYEQLKEKDSESNILSKLQGIQLGSRDIGDLEIYHVHFCHFLLQVFLRIRRPCYFAHYGYKHAKLLN